MKRWEPHHYLATAVDPIHIGTGGYRLGRVDLTICREPVTNVPKIPGTTMSGAAKFFADMALMDKGVKVDLRLVDKDGNPQWCASTQGSKHDKSHKETCPICYAFGYTPQTGSQGDSRQGILDFGDALLLLFPVRTMLGPVWVTSPAQMERLPGLDRVDAPAEDRFMLPSDTALTALAPQGSRLNIGWLYLQKDDRNAGFQAQTLESAGVPAAMAKRVALLPERLFEHVVNDQLEVRTSVVIDPQTGAADEGGLFTYEAVPRGAVFLTTIVVNDYALGWEDVARRHEHIPNQAIGLVGLAKDGLEAVGLGGMTTRGFGRLRLQKIG